MTATVILIGLLGLGVCILLAAFRLAERREDSSAEELLAARVDELTAENQRLRTRMIDLESANQRLSSGMWHPSLRRTK